MEDTTVQPEGSQGTQEGQGQGTTSSQDQGQQSGQQNSDNTSHGSQGGAGQEKPSTPATPAEPQVRKSNLEYILERQQRKAERDRTKQTQPQAQPSAPPASQGEDDLTPEEEKKFSKYLEKNFGETFRKIDGLAESGAEKDVQAEVSKFLSSKEGKYFAQYEKTIAEWAKHPSRVNIPIETIAMEAAGVKGMFAIGAAMERDAAKEAQESQAGGSGGTRNDTKPAGTKSVADMTNAEFLAYKAKVLQKTA